MAGVSEAFEIAMRTHQSGNVAEAARLYREILAVEPRHADARHLLGVIAHQQGEHSFAIEAILDAIARNPDFHGYHHNLGCIYLDLGRFREAVTCLGRALELDRNSAESHYNLATALRSVGRLSEAETACKHALRLKPRYAEARSNLGIVLEEQGRFAEALAAFTEALQMAPDYADAYLNRALLQLLLGNFSAGWREFDWLWKASVAPQQRTFTEPRWQGEPVAGRTILLHAEQGLGDTLQFIRYASKLAEQRAKVLVSCQPTLVSLVRSCEGVEAAFATNEALPPFDLQVPLPGLPVVFRTTLADVPAKTPYLFPNTSQVDRWRRELSADPAFKVGIVWQGEPNHRRDFYRSIPLVEFAPLADVAGVRLYSLQKQTGREQLQRGPLAGRVVDLADRLTDFSETAAVMQSLDLVIVCDTAAAHAAGAVGAPVWVALPCVPDWRWLLARDDSPWYPTMRLIRQSEIGRWTDVFQRIARDLAALVAARLGAD
jgi:Flp pilus assembly protein TadD